MLQMADWLKHISPLPRIVDHFPASPEWMEPQRVIYDHELMLFGKGAGVIVLGGVEYACPPHSYFIIPPGVAESSRNLTAHSWHRHWVHFDWIYQGRQDNMPINTFSPQQPQRDLIHFAPAFVPAPVLQGTLRTPEHVFDLFLRLEHRWNTGSPHERTTCRGLFLELLLELLDDQEARTKVFGRDERLARQVRQALEQLSLLSMAEMPPIQRFLDQFGCSYAHIARVFQRTYGISPLGYVNALRLERAKLLLQDTSLSISEVAVRTGFDDPSYFTRLFTRRMGMNPSAYRSNEVKN